MDIYTVKELVEKFQKYPQPWLEREEIRTEHMVNFLNDIDDSFFEHDPIPGPNHDENTVELIREKITDSWKNADARKRDLILKNKTTHKQKMIDRWKNPTDAMKNRATGGRPKGVKETKPRNRKEKKIYIDGNIYYNAKEAAKIYNIDPVNIRRRCRLDCYENWKYID